MKKMMFLSVMLVMAMCAANGFAQSTMDTKSKMPMNGSKNADSKFMMMAATGGMNEITLSNQALSKSANDDVKQFAQTMVDDHTKAGDELKAVAMSKNVMLPSDADAKHKAAAAKMASLSGSAFDMEYIKMMVKDHEATVAMFQKEANSGKDADAKAFAAKNLPTIQSHLDMARSMMTKMMSSKPATKMSGM